jgi:hypothetical protein
MILSGMRARGLIEGWYHEVDRTLAIVPAN